MSDHSKRKKRLVVPVATLVGGGACNIELWAESRADHCDVIGP